MGRAGRYTLSVMAWVAAYAGWSSLLGLIVAAATGDRPRTLSVGASALFTVIGPVVPTLVALWFNDWARDGFPTKEQRRTGEGRSGPSVPRLEERSGASGTEGPGRPGPEAPQFPVAPLVRDR